MASSEHLKSQTALAKHSGVPQSTIGRILRRRVDPQASNLDRIAEALGMSLSWFAEMGQDGHPAAQPTDITSEINPARVALISWGKASSIACPRRCEPDHWMPRPKRSGPKTFALRVEGESMEPAYQHGDIIFVDPDVTPVHGRDVVVRLNDAEAVAFKRLVDEGEGGFYLRPVNPCWPVKIIAISAYPGAEIIGVVVGKWVEI